MRNPHSFNHWSLYSYTLTLDLHGLHFLKQKERRDWGNINRIRKRTGRKDLEIKTLKKLAGRKRKTLIFLWIYFLIFLNRRIAPQPRQPAFWHADHNCYHCTPPVGWFSSSSWLMASDNTLFDSTYIIFRGQLLQST